MKTNLSILLLALPLATGLTAKDDSHTNRPHNTEEQGQAQSPAAILTAQVSEIASSPTMSAKSKTKLITNAVRLAITTATAEIKDQEKRLALALELTTAATKAAPQFATTISRAVSSLPAIASIKGAADEIDAAVKNAREASEEPDTANPTHEGRPHQGTHHHTPFNGPGGGEHVVSPSR